MMMANNIGTLVTAPVRPQAQEDTYAVAFSSEIKGGHHAVATLSDRDNIPETRREVGMTCYVASEKMTFELVDGILNANWQDTQRSLIAFVEVPAMADAKLAATGPKPKRIYVVKTGETYEYWPKAKSKLQYVVMI